MKLFKAGALALLSIGIATASFANELDQVQAPRALLVRVDAQGQTAVFQASEIPAAGTEGSAEVLNQVAQASNQIASLEFRDASQASELDRETSTRAWYWWGYGSYWNTWSTWNWNSSWFSYSYYNYSYRYPCYNMGYNWHWYWY